MNKFYVTELLFVSHIASAVRISLGKDQEVVERSDLAQQSLSSANSAWRLLHTEMSDFYPHGIQVLEKRITVRQTHGLRSFLKTCDGEEKTYLERSFSNSSNAVVLPLRCMVYGTGEDVYKGENVIYPHSCMYTGRFWHLVPDYMRFYSAILASGMLFLDHDDSKHAYSGNALIQKPGFLRAVHDRRSDSVPGVRALVLGAGGGSLSRLLQYLVNDPTLVVHTVELDPAVVKVAHDFFDFDPPEGNDTAKFDDKTMVFVEDALKFVQRRATRTTHFVERRSKRSNAQAQSRSDQHRAGTTGGKYDIIIQDICGKVKTPNAFLTEGWFSQVKALLKDGNSRYVINALSNDNSWKRTLGDVFGTTEIARISDHSIVWDNEIHSIAPQKKQPRRSTVWGTTRAWSRVGIDLEKMQKAIEVVEI